MNEKCRMWICTFSPPKMHILLSPWPSWVPAPLCFTGPSPLFLWMIDKTVINSVVFPPLPPLPHFSCLAFPSSPSTSTGYFRPPVLSVKVPLPRSPSPPGRGYRYAGGGHTSRMGAALPGQPLHQLLHTQSPMDTFLSSYKCTFL